MQKTHLNTLSWALVLLGVRFPVGKKDGTENLKEAVGPWWLWGQVATCTAGSCSLPRHGSGQALPWWPRGRAHSSSWTCAHRCPSPKFTASEQTGVKETFSLGVNR